MTDTHDVFATLSRLTQFSQQVEKLLADVQGEPPQHLFHYTNSAGLRGILETKKVWATHYRFLNDASEIDYGMYVLGVVVDQIKGNYKSPIVQDFLQRVLSTGELFEELDCYVACFCSKDDLLHQWRDYAGNGGYAIGFRAIDLLRNSGYTNSHSPAFHLRKVIYDLAEQGELVRRTLQLGIAELERLTAGLGAVDTEHVAEGCFMRVQQHLLEFITLFKHSSFEAEHEWRLCHLSHYSVMDHVKFRDGQFGLTPYVHLAPAAHEEEVLPIDLITHAPTKEAANVRFALKAILRANKYLDNVKIKGSIIPIRSC